MSGSGGGPFDFGDHKKDCKNVSSRAIINSPNQENLQLLKLDSIVELSLQSNKGPIVAYIDGNVLGSVLPSAMTDIIECMNSGTEFKGRVVVLNGAHCEILITAK
jgi:hypothetical protein